MKLNIKTKERNDMGMAIPSSPEGPRDYYPEFTVTQYEDDEQADLGDAPTEGTMTIRYSISRQSEDNKTGRCTYTVEVREVVSAVGDKDNSPSKKYDEAGDALDRLAKEKMSEKGEY